MPTKKSSRNASRTNSADNQPSGSKKPTSHKTPAPSASRTKKHTPAALQTSISKLDKEILTLLNERTALTTELIQLDDHPSQAVFDPRGDDELWGELDKRNQGPLPMDAVRAIFREVLSVARQKVKTQRVVYLAPSHSFSHQAALERFGSHAQLFGVSTVASIFEEVNRGNADYGIVPVENSSDSRVVDTLDMFTRLPLRICSEVQLIIHHHLLSNTPRGEITEIYGKPLALSQCRNWIIRNMPQARTIEVSSTAIAAEVTKGKPGAAAVAGRSMAVLHGLQIVAEAIEDNSHNITRFAVIGHDDTEPTGTDRTSVLLQIPHTAGALADAVMVFKKNKINMTWLESYTLQGQEAGCLFFVEFEGHIKEARIKRTLKSLEECAVRLEVLGSYPRSEPI